MISALKSNLILIQPSFDLIADFTLFQDDLHQELLFAWIHFTPPSIVYKQRLHNLL
jgi:hypothetical protein